MNPNSQPNVVHYNKHNFTLRIVKTCFIQKDEWSLLFEDLTDQSEKEFSSNFCPKLIKNFGKLFCQKTGLDLLEKAPLSGFKI